MSSPQSGADILARIRPTLREESTEICLRPDLLDEWQAAAEALEGLQAAGVKNQRMNAKPSKDLVAAAERVADLEKQIEDAAVVFTLRAVPREKWRALCDEHPPRKGNELDLFAGYNRDAVLDAAVRLCLVDPVFDDAAWGEFVAVVNDGEWDELRKVAGRVNREVGGRPKSPLASRILSTRGAASK